MYTWSAFCSSEFPRFYHASWTLLFLMRIIVALCAQHPWVLYWRSRRPLFILEAIRRNLEVVISAFNELVKSACYLADCSWVSSMNSQLYVRSRGPKAEIVWFLFVWISETSHVDCFNFYIHSILLGQFLHTFHFAWIQFHLSLTNILVSIFFLSESDKVALPLRLSSDSF